MPNNAKVLITGNLIKDPTQTNYNGNTVVSFTVAVNTTKKEGDKYVSDFYNVSVWGKSAEYILPKLQKGTMVQVIGEQQLQKYTDKNNIERQSLSVRATDVTALARQKGAPQRTDSTENTGDPF